MLNEPPGELVDISDVEGEVGAIGEEAPQMNYIQVTPQEKEAIERVRGLAKRTVTSWVGRALTSCLYLPVFPQLKALGFPESLALTQQMKRSDKTILKIILSSVQFSCSVISDSLRPHESQHAGPPCPSPTPGVHSDSRPSSP